MQNQKSSQLTKDQWEINYISVHVYNICFYGGQYFL